MQGEDGDAGGYEQDDEVFVKRVAFAEDGQVEEHYREELAGFGEDVGYVIYVGEGSVAEGRGEGGGDGDKEEGKEDAGGGENGGCMCGGAVGSEEVNVPGEGGEAGLNCVEEDRVLECGRGGDLGAVVGGENAFLEDGPGETVAWLVGFWTVQNHPGSLQ